MSKKKNKNNNKQAPQAPVVEQEPEVQEEVQEEVQATEEIETTAEEVAPEVETPVVEEAKPVEQPKEQKTAKGKTLVNNTRNKFMIGGVEVAPYAKVKITKAMKEDKSFSHAVKTGVLGVE